MNLPEKATFEALHRKGDATCPRSRLYVHMTKVRDSSELLDERIGLVLANRHSTSELTINVGQIAKQICTLEI